MSTKDGMILSYELTIEGVTVFTDLILAVSNLVYALENTGTVTVKIFDSEANYYNQLSGVLGTNAVLKLNDTEIFSGKIDVPLVWDDKKCELSVTITPNVGDEIITAPVAIGDINIPVESNKVSSKNGLYQRSGGKKTRGVGSVVLGNNDIIMDREADESKIGEGYHFNIDGVICLGYLETTNKLIATTVNMSYNNLPTILNRPDPGTDLVQEKPSVIYANGIHEEIQGKYIRLAIRSEYLVHRMCGWHSDSFSENRMTYANNFDLNDLIDGIDWSQFEDEIFKKATFKVNGEDTNVSYRRETDYFYYTCQISSIDFDNRTISLDQPPTDIWGEPILLDPSNCKVIGIYGRYPLTIPGKMYNDYPPEWNASGEITFYGDSPFGDGQLLSTIPGSVVSATNDELCTADFTFWDEDDGTHFSGNADEAYFSSITGNNAIDIIQYISNWDLEVQVGLYDMHKDYYMGRYYTDDVRVIDIIRDICKEACIAYSIVGNKLYLSDLTGELDTTPIIYEDSEVEIGTVKIQQTPYKDLKSIFVGKWKDILEHEDKITVNGSVVGRDKWTYDYEFYHSEIPVRRSVEYYACILGNSWELLSFNCFLSHMEARPVDYIQYRDWDAYIQTLELSYNTITLKTRTTRSLTAGVFPPELTSGDGTYNIDVCDGVSTVVKDTDDFSSGDDKYVAGNFFLPALVPKQGLNNYLEYISQSDVIKARVINVYNTCLAVKLVDDNEIKQHTYHEYFGENFYNAIWLVAFPDSLHPGVKAKEVKSDSGESTVWWTGNFANITCWLDEVSYLVTPDLVVSRSNPLGNSVINLLYNPQGYKIILDKFADNYITDFPLDPRKTVLTPFIWTGEGYSWAKNENSYVYGRDGNKIVVEGV